MNYPQIKPTLNLDFSNTKTLDPRINFRRGTPGAYYDGKTHAKAEENLISYSEEISKMGGVRVVVNDNSVDSPQGSQTASQVIMSDEYGWHDAYVYTIKPQKNSLTHSVYAKAGTGIPSVYFYSDDGGSRLAKFNLLTGEYIGHSGGQSYIPFDRYSIEDVGNDWYRIAVTILEPRWEGSKNYTVGLSQDTDDTIEQSSSGTDFCYLWGAQLEQRDSVTAYTPTTGTPVTKYQPKLMFASPDQPRFDHDVLTGESKGLLIEESRTNLIEYSEDFSSWQYNSNVVAKDNYIVAPDGTVGASEIVETTTNTQHNVAQSISTTGQKVFSVFVKKGVGSRNFRITDYNATDGEVSVTYNLSTGDKVSEAGSPGSTITYYSNGWYRISITSTTTTSSTYYIQLMDNNTTAYTGDGYSSIYIWGAQLEVGSFPTSYIKTSGASATRSADNASITGENFSSWYRQDEGSLFFEASTFDRDDGQARLTISDGTDSNRFYFGFLGSNILKVDSATQGSNIVNYDINFDDLSLGEYHKRSFGLKKDDFAVCINGELSHADTDSSGVIPAVNALHFSTRGVSHFSNSHIKKLSYYPQRLTNEQLQQLTK